MKIEGKKNTKGRKAPDKRPARAKYWASGRLAERKIRRMMASGMSYFAALEQWEATRKRNKGIIHYDTMRRKLGPKA